MWGYVMDEHVLASLVMMMLRLTFAMRQSAIIIFITFKRPHKAE